MKLAGSANYVGSNAALREKNLIPTNEQQPLPTAITMNLIAGQKTYFVPVPLAICGAFISLYLFKQTLNIFSQIGMIMLIGLVTKNGILIVEFANKKRKEGLSKADAVTSAVCAKSGASSNAKASM